MRLVALREVCLFQYGASLPDKSRDSGDVVVFGSNGPVGRHRVGLTSGQTIIIGRKGSIGQVHLSDRSCWPIDTTYFVDETCSDTDLEWLYYGLRHLKLGTLNRASGVPGLNRDDAYQQLLWVPETKDSQRRIAARLKGQLAEVEAAKQAAIAQAEDIALLRIRLLNEVFSTLAGNTHKVVGDYAPTTSGTTPARGNKRYWEPAEIPWVKTGEVAFASITRTEEAVSKIALAECSLTLLPPRTVLVAMYGQGKTRGQSAILEVAATTNQACFAILPNDTWEPDFLYYWLVASYQDLRDLSEDRGGNQANLNGALLKALEVPAPNRAQQLDVVRSIEEALHETDAMDEAGKSTLTELDLLPQRLLAQAFEN